MRTSVLLALCLAFACNARRPHKPERGTPLSSIASLLAASASMPSDRAAFQHATPQGGLRLRQHGLRSASPRSFFDMPPQPDPGDTVRKPRTKEEFENEFTEEEKNAYRVYLLKAKAAYEQDEKVKAQKASMGREEAKGMNDYQSVKLSDYDFSQMTEQQVARAKMMDAYLNPSADTPRASPFVGQVIGGTIAVATLLGSLGIFAYYGGFDGLGRAATNYGNYEEALDPCKGGVKNC